MSGDDDESFHSLSGAYAVDALLAVEAQAFEAHLGRCAECRAEVRSLREAAARLALPECVTAPPSLRAAVLAAAAAVRPLPPVTDRAKLPETTDVKPQPLKSWCRCGAGFASWVTAHGWGSSLPRS